MTDAVNRDDVSRPGDPGHHRINAALFGLLTVPEFASWFKARLGFAEEAVFYPPHAGTDEAGARRPDFEVVDPSSWNTIGHVDVRSEADEEQVARFRSIFRDEQVVAVWGQSGSGCDLSLERIADALASGVIDWPSEQARMNARHLEYLIKDALDGGSGGKADETAAVSTDPWDSPLILALRDALGDRVSRGSAGQPMGPGDIGVDITDSKQNPGFSVHVYTPFTAGKRVSIMNRRGGRTDLHFSCAAHLAYYLKRHMDTINDLCFLVNELGADMRAGWDGTVPTAKPEHTVAVVPLALAEEHAHSLAMMVGQLAGRPGA